MGQDDLGCKAETKETMGFMFAMLKAMPFLQPYIDMVRGAVLKFYLIVAALMNSLFVKLRALTQRDAKTRNKRKTGKSLSAPHAAEETETINVRVRIMNARNLPKMDKGSCDCYVRVKLAGKEFQTKPVTETLNPDFKNEFHFECRKDCKAQMVLELWDYDMPCDDYIGCCTVSVSTLVAQKKIDKSFEVQDKDGLPVRNETSRKPTKLRLGLSYNTVGEQGESEWLNGLVRKGYRCFGQDVDAKLHEVLTAALSSVRLPVVGSLLALKADGVSIGSEAPFLNELRLLPTRSAKDIQLRAQVRWVTSADFGLRVSIGVKWLNKLGLGLSASVSNLEIDFPVWIQVHLNQDLTSVVSKIQVAATAEPKVRLALSLGVFSTSSLPGVAEALELAIRKALTNVLVLPRKVSKALGQERPVLCSELERAGVARVSIKILEAQDIEDVQAMHKLDPYVVVRMLGSPAEKRGIPKYGMPQIYSTKHVEAKGSRCEWNEFVEFIVTDVENEAIELQLLDKGVVSDDACGKLLLQVQELEQAARAGMGWTEQWYPLAEAKSGRIRLAVEYAPFAADDGPTQPDDLCIADNDSPDAEPPAAAAASATHRYGSICLQIIRATNAPKTVLGGKPDAYVTVKYESYAGQSSLRTCAIESDCNPEWHEDLVMRERVPLDLAQLQDKQMVIALNDGSSSSVIDGDPCVATTTLKVSDVLAKPGEFHLAMMAGCTLVVKAHFEESKAEPLAAVGSDWINGVVRKAWHVLGKAVDHKVRIEVNSALHKLAHPEVDGETGKAQGLPGIKDLLLDRFSIGSEPPFFLELKLLNTRCVQDVQLVARLRWVCGSGMIIKVKAKGNTGVPDVIITISNLEIYFPAWIQVRLAGGGTGLGADSLDFGAVEQPEIKMRVSISAGVLPAGLSPATIDSLVKDALTKAFVLPNKIQVCLARDARDATGLVKMAANPKDHLYPMCPQTGKLLVAADADKVPLFKDIDAFKASRLRMTELEAMATGRVRLKVLEAAALPDPDGWGMVNAFVEVCIVGRGQTRTSSTHISTSPVWNELMDFLVVDEDHDVLAMSVRDRDLLNKHKSIELGRAEVRVCDLLNRTGWREAWLPLTYCAGKAAGEGMVHVALEYASLGPSEGPAPPNEFKLEGPAHQLQDDVDETPAYAGKVFVTVIKAENLVKLDWTGGGLDPYVSIDFGSQQKKTKTLSGLNPVWDQTYAFDCGKAGSSLIVLSLKDAEATREDRVVGNVSVSLDDLMLAKDKTISEGLVLRNARDRQMVLDGSGNRSTLHLTVKYLNDEDEAAAADPGLLLPRLDASCALVMANEDHATGGGSIQANSWHTGSLLVRVVRANDLPKMDWTGSTDAYVSITLDGQGKDKTRVLEEMLDPEWNEDFLFKVRLEHGVCAQKLLLTVKDNDSMGKNETIGSVPIAVQDVIAGGACTGRSYQILDSKGDQVIGKSAKGSTLTLDLCVTRLEAHGFEK